MFEWEEQDVATAEPIVRPKQKRKQDHRPQRQPRYHVVLWDDSHHTYEYVIMMMRELFGHPRERGQQMAKEVDSSGRVICMTTTLELAELKRDQIHAYGRDPFATHCAGSMSASIEPVPE